MHIKDDIEVIVSDDKWYDLFDGGYIKPEEILEDYADIQKVEKAIETIEEFYLALELSGKLQMM